MINVNAIKIEIIGKQEGEKTSINVSDSSIMIEKSDVDTKKPKYLFFRLSEWEACKNLIDIAIKSRSEK